jgi:membrane protease YdiL (CAAX protease family)
MTDGTGLRGLFWNDRERRPRALVRLALALVFLVVGGVGGVLASSALAALAPSTAGATVTALVTVAVRTLPLVGFVVGTLAAAWLVDRRELADLGLGRSPAWWADLAFGLALGVALPGLVFAVELAAGLLRVTGTLVTRTDASLAIGPSVAPALALALVLGYFVGVGVFEELLFRGYLLTNVAEGLAGWRGIGLGGAFAGATAVSGLAFGVAHGANPNVTGLALVNIALFGGLFAASYLLTGRIAAAIGLHISWNVSIASIFGFPVSGFSTPVTLVAVEQSGPAVLTGGSFGPEGGLVALGALVVGFGALVAWVRWREGELRWHESVSRSRLRGDSAGADPVAARDAPDESTPADRDDSSAE